MFSSLYSSLVFSTIEYFSYLNVWLIILFLFVCLFFLVFSSCQLLISSVLCSGAVFEFSLILGSFLFIVIIISPALIILLDSEIIIIPSFIVYSCGYQWAWTFSFYYLNWITNCDHYLYSSYYLVNIFYSSNYFSSNYLMNDFSFECVISSNCFFSSNADYLLYFFFFLCNYFLWWSFNYSFSIIECKVLGFIFCSKVLGSKLFCFILLSKVLGSKVLGSKVLGIVLGSKSFLFSTNNSVLFNLSSTKSYLFKFIIYFNTYILKLFIYNNFNTYLFSVYYFNTYLFTFFFNTYLFKFILLKYWVAWSSLIGAKCISYSTFLVYSDSLLIVFGFIFYYALNTFCLIFYNIIQWYNKVSNFNINNSFISTSLFLNSLSSLFSLFYFFTCNTTILIPILSTIRFFVFSYDVIHALGIYSFGIKIDAIPGRFNFASTIRTLIKGQHRGFCYELCGQNHSTMLIIGKSF